MQNLEKGTKVTVLEEMENWDQVQTQDGYIGYVQKKHLTDPARETPVKDTGYVDGLYRQSAGP
ncbi:MAG: SH3 domain-containing protein [Gallintestinimicrobium sp.]